MTTSSTKLSWLFFVLLFNGAAGRAPAEVDTELFERRIRPVLVEHCFDCHSARSKSVKGGLKLDTRSGLLTGGDTGPALVPGKPAESLLLAAMSHRNKELAMPPKKPRLANAILADVEKWRSVQIWNEEGHQ